MGRLSTSVITLIIWYGLGAASPTIAQPRETWGSLVGNWNLEFFGKDREPLGKGVFAFEKGFFALAGGLIAETTGQNKPLPCEGTFEGGEAKLQCYTYGFSTHFNLLTLRPSADGNALSGTWGETATATEPGGFVRGKRAKPPTIEKVEVLGEPPDYAEIKRRTAAGEREVGSIRIRLHGQELPIWFGSAIYERSSDKRVIRHIVSAWKKISIDDAAFRRADADWGTVHDRVTRSSEGYLDVIVTLDPGARPGRKTITVNGSSKTFDVVFRNYADSKVVELRFVRKDGSSLSEIGYGEPFQLEARFDVPPQEVERIVKLDWPGGTRDIPVVKQKDGKVFRSGLLYLEAR